MGGEDKGYQKGRKAKEKEGVPEHQAEGRGETTARKRKLVMLPF